MWMQQVLAQRTDGSWEIVKPKAWVRTLDLEVYNDGRWEMFWGGELVSSGRNRNSMIRFLRVHWCAVLHRGRHRADQ